MKAALLVVVPQFNTHIHKPLFFSHGKSPLYFTTKKKVLGGLALMYLSLYIKSAMHDFPVAAVRSKFVCVSHDKTSSTGVDG